MLTATAMLWVLTSARPVDKYTLTFFQDTFIVRKGSLTRENSLLPERASQPLSVTFRKDQVYAVWDDRGLTVRNGKKVTSTRLKDLAVSPKLFSADEIRQTLGLIKTKERSSDASSLAGATRIAADAFFLVRWTDSHEQPWLEALVRVRLTEKHPKPILVGKFAGLSTAYKPIDTRLFPLNGKVSAIVRKDDSFGVASYVGSKDGFDYRPIGGQLKVWHPSGRFVEETAYGTQRGGKVDLTSLQVQPLFEVRGTARFVDDESPSLALIRTKDRLVVKNLESGAELQIPEDAHILRSGPTVIVFGPGDKPKWARLYAPMRWKELADWGALKPPAETGVRPPEPHAQH